MKASGTLKRAIHATDASTSGKGMLAAIMVEWNGVAGLAHELRQEYEHLPEGHPARSKLQALILQAVLKFGGGAEDDDGDLDAAEAEFEEIERELEEIEDGNSTE